MSNNQKPKLINPNREHLAVEAFNEEYKETMKVNQQNLKLIQHQENLEEETPQMAVQTQ